MPRDEIITEMKLGYPAIFLPVLTLVVAYGFVMSRFTAYSNSSMFLRRSACPIFSS